jgi:hypothetical protein
LLVAVGVVNLMIVSQSISFDPVAEQYDSNSINIGSISYANTVRNGILLGVNMSTKRVAYWANL